MPKFILSRINDSATHSKKWVVGYALLFWLVTRIIAGALVVGCTAVYEGLGISHDMLPLFGGTPKAATSTASLLYGMAVIALIAPVIEETVFRLGLSFKRWQVALSFAFIPIFIGWSDVKALTVLSATIYLLCAAAIYFAVCRFTSREQWSRLKEKRLVTAMWITSLAFGLVHLMAFSFWSWQMVPYMLCMITVPFFCGCACAYLRVNLGFDWGLAMHIFNNIPGIVVMLQLSCG